jgi:pimeloyl-ACP methyl ester carboxylesterase
VDSGFFALANGKIVVAMASTDVRPDHLVWEQIEVDGRPAFFGHAGGGDGLPVLFLHGWGLAQHSYKRPLNRLARMGCRVYAPAQPGFGGTPDLPGDQFEFGGYAAWAAAFLDAVGVSEPALVIGHSFGGGVAIQLAHDHPERVRSLVLVNSIGTPRPLWDWAVRFPTGALPGDLSKMLPVVVEDALANLVRNPRSLWRVGHLARRANLTGELEELKRRELRVVVLWGDKDRIVPKESFAAMCAALGSEGEVVNGNHSWLLADPDAFGLAITNVVSVARMTRDQPQRRRLRERVGAVLRSAGRRAAG